MDRQDHENFKKSGREGNYLGHGRKGEFIVLENQKPCKTRRYGDVEDAAEGRQNCAQGYKPSVRKNCQNKVVQQL